MILEAMNNYVIVDTGVSGKEVEDMKIADGSIIYLATNVTDSVSMAKISGKVVGAPEKLVRTANNKMKYQVNPTVKVGEIVMFEPTAQSYCEAAGLRIESTSLAIPYHFLILRVDDNNDIHMLNGKILVEEIAIRSETDSGIIIPETIKGRKFNRVRVLKVGNDGFKGAYFKNGDLHRFGNDDISVGDELVVTKYSDHKVHGLVSEVSDVKDCKRVNRENIVYNVTKGNAFGMYLRVTVMEEDDGGGANHGIILIDSSRPKITYGRVESIGTGISGLSKGDYIKFEPKDHPRFRGMMFIHEDRLICKVSGDGLVEHQLDIGRFDFD